jgi:enoyl-CoA hydratase
MNGIVHALSPPPDFDAVVNGYTARIAANAPLSIAAAKSAIRAAVSGSASERAEAEAAVAACMTSDDYREGRTAFLQKRKATFQGR